MAVYDDSRYLRTPIITRLGWDVPTLDLRPRFNFNRSLCSTYTWTKGDTLDGVSYRVYGECALRWAILDANPKYRTEFEIEAGDILIIPRYDEVVNFVNV